MEILGIETGVRKFSPQSLPHRIPSGTTGFSSVNVGKWERMASIAIGGYLLYRMARTRGKMAGFLAPFAFSLLNRGVSGHCALYGKMKMSSTSAASPGA